MEQTKTTQTKESAKAKPVVTRAEKIKRQKSVILSVLEGGARKWNDLLEEATKRHIKLYGEEADVADLKGKIGSALSLLEEERTVNFDEKTNMCSLAAEKTEQKKRGRKKAEEKTEEPAPVVEENKEKAEPKKRGRKKKTAELPAETAAEPKAEAAEPKKRGRKKKTEENKPAETEEKNEEKEATSELPIAPSPAPVATVVALPASAPAAEKKIEEKVEEKKEEPKKPAWTDVSFFLGNSKKTEERSEEKRKEAQSVAPKKAVLPEFSFLGNAGLKKVEAAEKLVKEEPSAEKTAEKPSLKETPKAESTKTEQNRTEQKSEENPAEAKNGARASEAKLKAQPQQQRTAERRPAAQTRTPAPKKIVSEEEALKTTFLKKLRSLGGAYFEYYSVYLLERYSLKNGRRLEGLKVSGGTGDGGIDGEIELTDKFGFREVIYIQSKNWDPSKGDSEKWTVGETLLQQFIGAVACRQAKERRRKCRGIFVTASRFTDGAREILENMSADFIGYDGDDVFEAAKECEFGLKQVNGKWALDDKLLSGEKAFFDLL